MINRSLIIITLLLSIIYPALAQEKGILALTGTKYFKDGINAKQIEIKVDGNYLLSNRVSLNKEIEVRLQSPSGFTEDKAKTIFAGAELVITNQKGAVLFKNPDYIKGNEVKGSIAGNGKELIVKIPVKAEVIKAEPGCNISLRFFDLKGKNQLRLEIPVVISGPGEAMQLSKTLNGIPATGTTQAFSSAVKIKKMEITLDTSIRVAPKMAYASMDMTGIEGSSLTEVLSGKESFWVYDSELNEVKITDKQLKQVKGSMEDNSVDYLSKIPFRLKGAGNKTYFVRLRWESTDKRKIIDIVITR